MYTQTEEDIKRFKDNPKLAAIKKWVDGTKYFLWRNGTVTEANKPTVSEEVIRKWEEEENG